VVYASSSSVYGNAPVLPRREEEPLAPCSPYAVSKAEGEVYARLFAELYGLETVGLRYFNVYGPRQDEASPYAAVIPRFIGAALAGRPPVIYGDGEQTRDFTYVADVVRANLLAAEAPGVSGEVFNIAGGAETSINELFALVGRAVGRLGLTWAVQPLHEPARPGEVRRSRAEVVKAEERLGFRAQVSLEEGLARTVEWFGRMRKG
ncbi:MAG: GDP-mannose 4,6-dehydratase, partial [Bacillota bacterium]|nr:GDP-mannose 4,6-dehydratase [Bacillota bacterium]